MALDLQQIGGTIGGHDIRSVQKVLSHIGENPGRKNLNLAQSLVADEQDSAILIDELLGRELITVSAENSWPGRWLLTPAGKSVVQASANRSLRSVADRILQRLLERIETNNADAASLYRVDEVWIFGSMLRDSETVGDIDIVIDGSVRKATTGQQNDSLMGSSKWSKVTESDEQQFRKTVFASRKHPLISLHRRRLLEQLACPCRMIFDAVRGGRVSDVTLDRHPGAGSRAVGIQKTETPDLSVPHGLPLPIHVGWVSNYNRAGACKVAALPVALDCRGVILLWSEGDAPSKPWNGRDAVRIADAAHSAASVTLRRVISERDGAAVVSGTFEAFEGGDFDRLASMSALILATDAENCRRRLIEQGHDPAVRVELVSVDLEDVHLHALSERVVSSIGHLLGDGRPDFAIFYSGESEDQDDSPLPGCHPHYAP